MTASPVDVGLVPLVLARGARRRPRRGRRCRTWRSSRGPRRRTSRWSRNQDPPELVLDRRASSSRCGPTGCRSSTADGSRARRRGRRRVRCGTPGRVGRAAPGRCARRRLSHPAIRLHRGGEPMPMDYDEYLRRLPKVELHCHVEGTLRPQTVVELAAKHDIALPTTDVDRIYDYDTIYEFLEIFRLVNSTVIDRDDFARIAYESLEDGVEARQPQVPGDVLQPDAAHDPRRADGDDHRRPDRRHAARPKPTSACGCRLIADVYRQDPPADGDADDRGGRRELGRDEVIGLGMDAAEAPDPPEQFAECFAARGRSRAAPHEPRLPRTGRRRTSPRVSTCSAASGSTTATTSSKTTRWSTAAATTASTSRAVPTSTAVGLRLARPHHAPDQRDDRRPACSCTSTPTTRRCSTPTSARSTSTSSVRTTTRRRWRRPGAQRRRRGLARRRRQGLAARRVRGRDRRARRRAGRRDRRERR